MTPLLIIKWADVEEALIRQVEGELDAGDGDFLLRRQEDVLHLAVNAEDEGNVAQWPCREGAGIEDLVESERASKGAVELDSAGAAEHRRLEVAARSGRVGLVGFDQLEIDEVGAVSPSVEVRRRIALTSCLPRSVALGSIA